MNKIKLPHMDKFTQMINKHDGHCDFECFAGENATINGTFTASQLRTIAKAMDEHKKHWDEITREQEKQ